MSSYLRMANSNSSLEQATVVQHTDLVPISLASNAAPSWPGAAIGSSFFCSACPANFTVVRGIKVVGGERPDVPSMTRIEWPFEA